MTTVMETSARPKNTDKYIRQCVSLKWNGEDYWKRERFYTQLFEARKRKRLRLVEAQGHRCAVCSKPVHVYPDDAPRLHDFASIEHVQNVSDGGTDSLFNLIITCLECNKKRGTEDIFAFYARFKLDGFTSRKVVPKNPKYTKAKEEKKTARHAETMARLVLAMTVDPNFYDNAVKLLKSDLR